MADTKNITHIGIDLALREEPKANLIPRCDTCGDVATSRAIDVMEYHDGPYVRSESVGSVKYGCDQHPAIS